MSKMEVALSDSVSDQVRMVFFW